MIKNVNNLKRLFGSFGQRVRNKLTRDWRNLCRSPLIRITDETLGNEESVLLPSVRFEPLRLEEVGDGLREAGGGWRGEQGGGHLPLYPWQLNNRGCHTLHVISIADTCIKRNCLSLLFNKTFVLIIKPYLFEAIKMFNLNFPTKRILKYTVLTCVIILHSDVLQCRDVIVYWSQYSDWGE